MTILSQLYSASFRGVSFYVRDSSIESGRKTITHEFPNADRRYVEDLGRLQTTYRIKALVTGNSTTYISNRNSLIKALEQPGLGQLIHPFYGTINVTPKPFTLSESIRELNFANFDLVFEASQDNIYPNELINNLSRINVLSEESLSILQENISNVFNVNLNYLNNFQDAQNVLNNLANSFLGNTNSFTRNLNGINDFSSFLSQYTNNINSNILNPSSLASNNIQLFEQTQSVIPTPKQQIETYQKFYDFNDNLQPVPQTTVPRVQRQVNRDIIKDSVQANALIKSYQAAPEIEYSNINELNETQKLLEDQYNKIQQSNVLDDNTKISISNIRNENRKFFDQEKLSINKIASINTKREPLSVLSYRYYGNTQRVDELRRLNNIKDPAFVEGDVDILVS